MAIGPGAAASWQAAAIAKPPENGARNPGAQNDPSGAPPSRRPISRKPPRGGDARSARCRPGYAA